ncbi:hypothetical protein GpartN1_g1793.t1 [Galdieria partita]|uniref:2-dehydropantoate 2-reductase n=1 Tax=Galdieria partita TaxID=83374 RepID=A0A9C7PUT1_9RHOD|nr:hypothetical protein GpartN1_g1793.t1 [Galdieria partita]
MKSLVVVGNGSLGLWWCFHLTQLQKKSLCKAFLVTRTEESAQSINEKGIIVEDKTSAAYVFDKNNRTMLNTSNTVCFHCPSFSNLKQLSEKLQGYADILLLCVKQYHLKSALENCTELLSSKGVAVSFCNGIGNLETVASFVGANRAAAAITYEAVERINSRTIIHWSSGRTIFADTLTYSPELNANLQFLHDILKQQNLPIELLNSVDARKEMWKKLAVNCVINPLATIIRVRNGLLSDRIPESLFEGICWEIVRTAERSGIILDHSDLMVQISETIKNSSRNICSTLQDIQNGRPTEIEALNGAVAHLARKYGLSVPYCETLFHLVKAMEARQDTTA